MVEYFRFQSAPELRRRMASIAAAAWLILLLTAELNHATDDIFANLGAGNDLEGDVMALFGSGAHNADNDDDDSSTETIPVLNEILPALIVEASGSGSASAGSDSTDAPPLEVALFPADFDLEQPQVVEPIGKPSSSPSAASGGCVKGYAPRPKHFNVLHFFPSDLDSPYLRTIGFEAIVVGTFGKKPLKNLAARTKIFYLFSDRQTPMGSTIRRFLRSIIFKRNPALSTSAIPPRRARSTCGGRGTIRTNAASTRTLTSSSATS